jgi:hypothetical protein
MGTTGTVDAWKSTALILANGDVRKARLMYADMPRLWRELDAKQPAGAAPNASRPTKSKRDGGEAERDV